MNDERTMTLHPEGKAGVNIERWKHDRVRAVILGVLANADAEGVRFRNVRGGDENDLIDLEVRDELERVSKVSPQRVRVPGNAT